MWVAASDCCCFFCWPPSFLLRHLSLPLSFTVVCLHTPEYQSHDFLKAFTSFFIVCQRRAQILHTNYRLLKCLGKRLETTFAALKLEITDYTHLNKAKYDATRDAATAVEHLEYLLPMSRWTGTQDCLPVSSQPENQIEKKDRSELKPSIRLM